jgi:hypothetical protein
MLFKSSFTGTLNTVENTDVVEVCDVYVSKFTSDCITHVPVIVNLDSEGKIVKFRNIKYEDFDFPFLTLWTPEFKQHIEDQLCLSFSSIEKWTEKAYSILMLTKVEQTT